MPRQLWSHPGTVVFGDRVGILSFKSQLHLWFWPEEWLESLQKEGQFSLDRNQVYAWPLCGSFLIEPNKIFRGQRDLGSKCSPGHISCALWYLCTYVVGVSPGISAGDFGIKTSPCIWRDHSLMERRHVWTTVISTVWERCGVTEKILGADTPLRASTRERMPKLTAFLGESLNA